METPGRAPGQRRPPSGHRKSHSTTAISAMADTPDGLPSRRKASVLPPLDDAHTSESVTASIEVIRSLRSSSRRRGHALRQFQAALVSSCSSGGLSVADLLSLKCHEPILALLGRHTASLAKRGSTTSLAPGDELANHLVPEIDLAVMILQGLCLVSKSCKDAVGQKWAMEMFLDLILLLRTQIPPEGQSPPVYLLLDLLFCILVDAPQNARMFEELQGLEAVTRVLRGSGVEKDVKMKCCEFLYFYLQPEGAAVQASRGVSASSSNDSGFHTPEPQSSQSFIAPQDVTLQSITSHAPSRASSEVPLGHDNFDPGLPFIPQTPRKPPKPTLGFQTPSAHRREMSSNSSGTSLAPVPPSPRSSDDDGSLTKRDSAAWAEAQRKMDARSGNKRTVSSSSSASNASSTGSSTSSSTVVPAKGTIRHRSSMSASIVPSPSMSASSGLSRSSSRASSSSRPSFSRASSSASTAAPPRATTQLAVDNDPALLARRGSKHISKSPLAQSTTPNDMQPHRRHSRAQSAAPNIGTPGPSRSSSSATPGVQRSRGFPSELTKGALPSATPSPVPLNPSRRVPSGAGERPGDGPKGMRSVAEKKALLGNWLGNVDQLVEGVERVGFLGSKP